MKISRDTSVILNMSRDLNSYSYCFVPECKNTSVSAPDKFFFAVPKTEARKLWCSAVGRDPDSLSLKSTRRCCQDHFKLEEDVHNWLYYKALLDAQVEKMPALRLKPGVLPRLIVEPEVSESFYPEAVSESSNLETEASSSSTQQISESSHPVAVSENSNLETEAPCSSAPLPILVQCSLNVQSEISKSSHLEEEAEESCRSTPPPILDLVFDDEQKSVVSPLCSLNGTPPNSKGEGDNAEVQKLDQKLYTLKGTKRKRSKSVQTEVRFADKETQTHPIKNGSGTWSVILSPEPKRHKIEEESESEARSSQTSEYKPSSQTSQSQDHSGSQSTKEELLELELKTNFVRLYQLLMERSPMRHLGISKDKLGLIEILQKFTGCSKRNIYICLRKIRKNESFDDMAEIFGVCKGTVSSAVHETIPLLSAYLSSFIFWPSSEIIKSNLPPAFRINYTCVESIIDCFEIFITKPSDAVIQAQVYSEYKHHTTIKYLISVTPDGLINFVSKGYGGRTSDLQIVKKSGFLDALKPGIVVMADRGFKEIVPSLMKKNCKLVRPPSVYAGQKLSKIDARLAKIVASLRINVERIIGRIRDFYLFYAPPYHHHLLNLADQAVIVGCALANIQKPIYR